MSLDIPALLTELTLAEKASLTSGSGFWFTAAVERLGIPRIMVSDGPHGLRAQPGEGDHVGLGGSLPATCFPSASAVASAWNRALLHRIGQDVAFPFGFGLSYTSFALSDLDVALSGSVEAGDLAAALTATVTNTGSVAGAEVVQVYLRDVDASVTRPVRDKLAERWASGAA